MLSLMWRKLRSTHSRMLGLIFVIELALVATMLFSVYHLVRTQIDRDDTERAVDLRDDLMVAAREQRPGALAALVQSRASRGMGELLLLTDAQGRKIAGNVSKWPDAMRTSPRWRVVWLRAGVDNAWRPFGVIATALPDGRRLIAGHLLESSTETKRIVSVSLMMTLLFALPLAFAGAWGVVRLINQRIARITHTARAVAAGDLEGRIAVDGSGDRFDQLGQTINQMLDRLARLVAELRLVTDSLAHDLRSPLTRLRARIDRCANTHSEEALREEIQAVADEADTLLKMLSTALEISQAEAGIGRDHIESCNLSELMRDLADLYQPLVEEHERALIVDAPLPIFAPAHRELMSRVVSNLIDNSLKYGAGRIRLASFQAGKEVVVLVEDQGEGIAENQKEEALRRFGRLDPARGQGGAGMGLSLVQAVVAMHSGRLELCKSDQGFEVIIFLPA